MVKVLRHNGLTETEIANELDIDPSFVNRIKNESGKLKGVNIGARLTLFYLEKADVLPVDKVSVCTNTNTGNT